MGGSESRKIAENMEGSESRKIAENVEGSESRKIAENMGDVLGTRFNVPAFKHGSVRQKLNIISEADSGYLGRGPIYTGV